MKGTDALYDREALNCLEKKTDNHWNFYDDHDSQAINFKCYHYDNLFNMNRSCSTYIMQKR